MAAPSFRILAAADQPAYDAFVSQHALNDFCQAWAWGDVKGSGEWQPVRVGVEQDGRLVAAAQVLFRPLALGRTLAYASRGPIVDLVSPDARPIRDALVGGLAQLCGSRGAIALKLDPCLPVGDTAWAAEWQARPAPEEPGHFGGTQPKWVMRLDLTPGLERVFAEFKPDYRNRIRKSEKRGVTVRLGETPADWAEFYGLLTETAARQEFGIRSQSYFDQIAATLTGDCQAALFCAEREGRMVGGILCVGYGTTGWYLYGGMNEEGREHYSGYLLQWRAMEWSVARGCRVYDFRGVAPPWAEDTHLFGLNRFKSGFGPELVEWVGEYDLVYSPLAYRAFTVLLPKVRAWLKRRRR